VRVLSRFREEFSFLHGNILVLVVSWILVNFASGIPSPYYALYVLELGGTPFIIGLIGFVAFAILALVQFPGGYLADKHGRRRLIVVMTFGVALSYTLFALATSWHFILLGVVLQNLFLIYQPALFALQADSMPAERRGMGFSTVMFVNNLSALFSPVIAGFLYIQYGLVTGVRIAYAIVTTALLGTAIIRVKLTETLPTNKSERISLGAVAKSYPRAIKEGIGVWKLLPRSMFFLFLTNALSSFIYALSYSYWVVYATRILHIKEFEWAIMMTWLTLTMILFALPSGKLTDKIGRKKPLLVSWLVLAPFGWLFLNGTQPTLFIAFLCFGVSNALFMASYSALEADLVPKELRGKEIGCSQFITYLSMAVGELIGGYIYQCISPVLPLLLLTVVTVPCVLVTVFFIHEPHKRQS